MRQYQPQICDRLYSLQFEYKYYDKIYLLIVLLKICVKFAMDDIKDRLFRLDSSSTKEITSIVSITQNTTLLLLCFR
jgi:hypothetical protein